MLIIGVFSNMDIINRVQASGMSYIESCHVSFWLELDALYNPYVKNLDSLVFDYGFYSGTGEILTIASDNDSRVYSVLNNVFNVTGTNKPVQEEKVSLKVEKDTLIVKEKCVVFYYKSTEEWEQVSETEELYLIEEYSDYFNYLERFESLYADSLRYYGIKLVISTNRYISFSGLNKETFFDRAGYSNLGIICFSPDSAIQINSGVNIESGYLRIINEYFGLSIQESKLSDNFPE